MATKPKTSETVGKVKFRVIEFELEGTDASLQESLKNLAVALNRGNAVPPARQLRATTKQIEANGEAEPEVEAEDAEVVDEQETEAPAPRPAAPRKPPRVK